MLAFDKPWDWIIIAILAMMLFGYKKMPDAARSLGRSLRIFKTEIKGLHEDEKPPADTARPAQPQQLTAAPGGTPTGVPTVEQPPQQATAIGDAADGR